MYQLDAYGAPIQLCSAYNNNLARYGCTAYDGYYSYPYASNPASVNIQIDYLLDVVAKEMGPSNDLTAMYAQAIVSRSYAHWHIENSAASINNSAGFQVFVPYAFDTLSSVDQQKIRDAVSPNYYLSWSYSQLPAKAMFGADAWARTVTGDKPYLAGIEDPISGACDASNGPPGQPYHRMASRRANPLSLLLRRSLALSRLAAGGHVAVAHLSLESAANQLGGCRRPADDDSWQHLQHQCFCAEHQRGQLDVRRVLLRLLPALHMAQAGRRLYPGHWMGAIVRSVTRRIHLGQPDHQ
jgi:hypothetical protein